MPQAVFPSLFSGGGNFPLEFAPRLRYNGRVTGRCDGIGRRSGLKIHRWRQRTGSSPVTGTTSEQTSYRLLRLFYKSQSALTPLLLLSAKSHAQLTCSVASALAAVRCRYQLFADLCLAALEIHFVSPLQQEEYRARQRAMLFFYPLCQGTRILPVQNADRRTNKGKGTVAQCMNIHRD